MLGSSRGPLSSGLHRLRASTTDAGSHNGKSNRTLRPGL